jgi:putative salt-induced outer membrane protein YdiY
MHSSPDVSSLQVTHQRAPRVPSRRLGALAGRSRDIPWSQRHLAVSGRIVAGFLVVAALAQPAEASHGKTDVVTLANGDRITCEIKGLDRAKLTVKTDAMGTFGVEWHEVRRIESPAIYEVELTSGVRLLGSLRSPADGQVHVADPASPTTVLLLDIFTIVPIEAGFWQRLDGSISFGYSYTQSDNRSQYSLDATATRRTPTFVTQTTLSSLLTMQTGQDRQTRNTGTVVVERLLGPKWFAGVLSQLSQNEQLGLNLRTVVAGGIGRNLITSRRTLVAVLGGVAYTHEDYSDSPGQTRAEAVLDFAWNWFVFGNRDTTLDLSVVNYYALNGEDRYRMELNETFSRKVFKDFTVGTNIVESFDSKPPSGQRRNDLSVSVTAGWTF